MDFIEKISLLKKKSGLNNRTLSIQSGIPYSTIDFLYKKGYENIKLGTLKKLAAFFDVSIDYLVRDEITDPNFGKEDPNEETFEFLFRSLTEDEKNQTIRFMRGLLQTREKSAANAG